MVQGTKMAEVYALLDNAASERATVEGSNMTSVASVVLDRTASWLAKAAGSTAASEASEVLDSAAAGRTLLDDPPFASC